MALDRDTAGKPRIRTRYRVVVFDDPRGPWRDTFDEAKDDAIAAGLASYDQSRREYFLAVPVAIQTERLRD